MSLYSSRSASFYLQHQRIQHDDCWARELQSAPSMPGCCARGSSTGVCKEVRPQSNQHPWHDLKPSHSAGSAAKNCHTFHAGLCELLKYISSVCCPKGANAVQQLPHRPRDPLPACHAHCTHSKLYLPAGPPCNPCQVDNRC